MTRRRDAEDELARLLTLSGGVLAEYERQHAYVPGRRFAADFAWPDRRLLVEIQGGIYTGGAHGSVEGIKRDIERLNLATLHGWRLLRFAPDAILREEEQPETLELIEAVLVGDEHDHGLTQRWCDRCGDLPEPVDDDGRSLARPAASTRPQRIRAALDRALGGE